MTSIYSGGIMREENLIYCGVQVAMATDLSSSSEWSLMSGRCLVPILVACRSSWHYSIGV